MKKKFVSEVITKEEILTWEDNDSVRILGETGSGKTYWAINTLAPICDINNKKILFLVHRRSLYEQVLHDTIIANVDNTITVKTYQSIITKYKFGILDLSNYDIIIFDEYQFLTSDANFISDTEIIYNLIKLDTKQVKIFISANDMDFGLEFNKQYIIGNKTKDINDRVSGAYILPNKHHFKGLIKELLDTTDDKMFVYINSNDTMLKLIKEFKDEIALYVSEDNPLFKYTNQKDIENLAINNKVDKRIILANSSIDAGVSIIDKDLKHIIAEERDIEKLYQVIGRKRIVDNEKFDLYIADLHPRVLGGYKRQTLRQLELIKEYENNPMEFYRQHGRDRLNHTIFYTDTDGILRVNKMAKYYLRHMLVQYEDYLETGYSNVLEMDFGVSFVDVEYQEKKETLVGYLDSIVGEELYQEEQQELSDKIASKLVNSKSIVRGKKMRPSTIEKILRDEFKLDYSFSSPKRRQKTINGKRTTRRYVILNKLN